jgi:peroxiredoxin (alkyl hydroperoxide reductase subunit C)
MKRMKIIVLLILLAAITTFAQRDSKIPLLELANMQDEFKELDVDIIVVSTDKLSQHLTWVEAMENLELEDRDQVKIPFPLVDDYSKTIAEKYGMLHDHTNTTRYVRGVYIIDPENNVRFTQFYPMEVGRSIHEIKRVIIALQTAQENDVVIPSDFNPGDDVLLYHYKTKDLENPNVNQVDWFLTYKKIKSNP